MSLTEKVGVMEKHYDATPILLGYIIKKAHEGDEEARKTLDRWDEKRYK